MSIISLFVSVDNISFKLKNNLLKLDSQRLTIYQIDGNSIRILVDLSLINNWMGRMNLRMGASGVRSKVWVLTIRVPEANPERDSVQDGLWRPGGAFFQIGLGCMMSHHHT